MQTYGIIGRTLAHSFSKEHFMEKFRKEQIEADFKVFEIEDICNFPAIVKKTPDLLGLSVTVPYKESVIPLLDELDETARNVGAVNCIKITGHPGVDTCYLKGFNTDIYGFRHSLLPFLKEHHTKAMILGTGGAAKAVEYVLKEMGIEYLLVTRKPANTRQLAYEQISGELLKSHQLIINATPLGMYPSVEGFPLIPYEDITPNHLLFDLIYNPSETLFLKKGRKNGATTVNGMQMLQLQAERSWEIWNSGSSN